MEHAKQRSNITILEHTTLLDLLCQQNCCYGAIIQQADETIATILAANTILATGGIGGLYSHSTNFGHLTGDSLAIAQRHQIALKNIDYIQIHPTTLYSQKPGRRFLISESVRGEGAVLLNAAGERFTDELQPRDVVAQAIYQQMELDCKPYVHLSLLPIKKRTILQHFPTIYQHCLEEGYDITKEPIPIVPAQHYFMGGIQIDLEGRTSMQHLYAAGEIRLQRRTWSQSSGMQFAAGKPGICPTGSVGHPCTKRAFCFILENSCSVSGRCAAQSLPACSGIATDLSATSAGGHSTRERKTPT